MNPLLARLFVALGVTHQTHEPLRLAFGLACACRVRHLLEDPRAIECLEVLQGFVDGKLPLQALLEARTLIGAVANGHRGSNSIDGSAHAAVSATYCVANALAGRALDAASYATYASVYAYGSYAVGDPSAFESEFAWQAETFKALAHHAQPATAVSC